MTGVGDSGLIDSAIESKMARSRSLSTGKGFVGSKRSACNTDNRKKINQLFLNE